MKKAKYLFFLASAGFLLASCSQDDMQDISSGGDGTYSITINLPKTFSTRALGDGQTALNLSYAVYDADNNNAFISEGTTTFEGSSLSTTVNLNFVAGKQYKVAFFAQSAASMTSGSEVYDFDGETNTLTVNYANMNSADNIADAYDCFYGLYSSGTVTNGATKANVTLTRPVAQINWGTNDLTDSSVTEAGAYGANAQYLRTTLTTSAYTTLNLLDGTVGTQAPVTFTNFAAPASTNTFPVEDYDYIAVYYLLAPAATSTNYDFTLTVNNSGNTAATTPLSNKIEVSNASVEANYQTNIYGELLTSPTDFTVTKDQAWGGTADDLNLTWDGKTVTYPTVNNDTKTVAVNQPSDLAGLAAMVNGENGQDANNFDQFTIELANDFNMGGNEFPMIGSGSRDSSNVTGNSFKGKFDGKGHTISNMVINGSSAGANDVVGFIANLDGEDASLQNVTFENLEIDATNNDCAGVVATVTNGATVSGVTVKSGTIKGKGATGAVAGRVIAEATVSECNNYASVSSNNNAGGVIGAAYYTSADGVAINVSNCNNYGNVTGTAVATGGVIGLSAANVTGCSNEGTITGGSNSTGGVIGQQDNAGTVKSCNNSGTIIGGSGYGSGGIVGWVKYDGAASAYPFKENITVTECHNTASVTGSTGAGGIVGIWYMSGSCTDNINEAPKLSATQWAAGIIGGQQWTTEGPNGNQEGMLYVTGNVSTTPMSAITGGGTNQYIYVNSPANVSQSNNTDTLPAN